jgi:hypothetical protein
MRELTAPQADDLYELITERASRPLILTSNRSPADDHSVIDLDSDAYFDLEGLRQFAALLAQDGMDHPGPPGAARTQCRARHGVCDRLAAVIAERAGRNFLVAAMAAVPLSTARTMTDPAAKGFDPAGIASGVGEALSKYLDWLSDQRGERDRELLTALAYARGAGLDDPGWLAFAAAFGYDARVADLDALRPSPAAGYLLQTTDDRPRRPPGHPAVPPGPHRRAARRRYSQRQRARRSGRSASGAFACGAASSRPPDRLPAWMATHGRDGGACTCTGTGTGTGTNSGGDVLKNRAVRGRMTIRPGTMKATAPTRAPGRPRSRHAQKIVSWVDAGPGSRL